MGSFNIHHQQNAKVADRLGKHRDPCARSKLLDPTQKDKTFRCFWRQTTRASFGLLWCFS